MLSRTPLPVQRAYYLQIHEISGGQGISCRSTVAGEEVLSSRKCKVAVETHWQLQNPVTTCNNLRVLLPELTQVW
jgi:hypothetical protein